MRRDRGAQRQPKWTNETSVGRGKNLKPLFQFLCAFTTAHIYSWQELTHCIPPNKNLSLFRPALIFCSPFLCCKEGKKHPTPGSTDWFSWHIHSDDVHERDFFFFSFDRIFLCWWYVYMKTGRNGMNVEGLYIVLFFIHIYSVPTYKVLFCIGAKAKTEEK